MTPEQLLQEFEQSTYAQRVYRMIELGHMIDNDKSVAETITQLTQGTTYQRLLALQSCYGSRDTVMVLQALADSSYSVRSLALNLVVLHCNDTDVQKALDAVSPAMQTAIVRHLYRRRRQTPINMYVETVVARQDTILKTLLPFGSQEVVMRHLVQVQEQFELADWRRLARLHPSLAVASLSTQTHATDIVDQEHQRLHNLHLFHKKSLTSLPSHGRLEAYYTEKGDNIQMTTYMVSRVSEHINTPATATRFFRA